MLKITKKETMLEGPREEVRADILWALENYFSGLPERLAVSDKELIATAISKMVESKQ